MNKKKIVLVIFIIMTLLFAGCSDIKKSTESNTIKDGVKIIDTVGREVIVPKKVERVACLYSFTGHAVVMLGGGENIVAVVEGLTRDIVLNEICPNIQDSTVPKANGTINIEELAKTKPDVALVSLETSKNEAEVEQLNKFNIPYLVVDFNTMDEQRYAVKMIGEVLGCKDKAEKYDNFYERCISIVNSRVKEIPEDKKIRVYHSVNELVRTDAKGTLPADWMECAGANNVSVNEKLRFSGNKYFASIEQILLWDPEVIIVNEEGVDKYILSNEQWKNLKAVKNNRVYKMPNGVSRWGHPSSIETPLAILWTAKILYPDMFKDIDMKMETKEFYKEFYNYDLTDEEAEQILQGNGMRKEKGE